MLADLCPLIYDGGKGGGAQRTSSSATVEIDRVTIRSVVSVDRLILTVTRPSIVQIYLISETIQDMTTTTVENEYELLCDLSKGAIFNDFAEVICLLTAQARNRRTDRQTDGKAISIRTLAKNSGDKAGPDETPFRRLCYTRVEHPTICYLRQGETYAIRSVCFVCHFLRHLVYMSLLCPRPVGGGRGH